MSDGLVLWKRYASLPTQVYHKIKTLDPPEEPGALQVGDGVCGKTGGVYSEAYCRSLGMRRCARCWPDERHKP